MRLLFVFVSLFLFFTQFCFNFVTLVLLLLLVYSTKIYRLSQYSWLRILQYFSFVSNGLVVAARSWFCFLFSLSLSYVLILESKSDREEKEERNEYCIFYAHYSVNVFRIQIQKRKYWPYRCNWNRQSKVHVSSQTWANIMLLFLSSQQWRSNQNTLCRTTFTFINVGIYSWCSVLTTANACSSKFQWIK